MRQAVRVGRQILLPRLRSQGKTGIQSVAAVSSTNVRRSAAKDSVPSVSNASLHRDGSTSSLELLTFLPNQPGQRPLYSCDGSGVGAFASNCPIASSQIWTGGPVKFLCRENLALSTALYSVMSPSKLQLIRSGGSTHPLLQATPDMGRTRWILILCAWTIVGLLFAVRRIVLVKLMGTQ